MNYDLKNQAQSNNTIWKKKEKLHVQMEILSWMLKHATRHVMTWKYQNNQSLVVTFATKMEKAFAIRMVTMELGHQWYARTDVPRPRLFNENWVSIYHQYVNYHFHCAIKNKYWFDVKHHICFSDAICFYVLDHLIHIKDIMIEITQMFCRFIMTYLLPIGSRHVLTQKRS